MERGKILERVRKMLALANNPAATEGERDNAMRMAHATLAKYNLDLEDVPAEQREKVDPRVIVKACFYGRPWARRVVCAVAEMLFCLTLFTPAKKANDTTHWFIGKESNATTAADLSQWLVNTIWKEAHKRARERGLGNEYARHFATGASIRIAERCRELRESDEHFQHAPTPGTALVLASLYTREREANQLVMSQIQTRESKSRAKSLTRSDALTDGHSYGNTLHLGKSIEKKS